MSRDLPLADVSSEVDFTVALVGASGVAAGTMTPTGFQQLTGLDPASALTVPADTNYAILTSYLDTAFWRADGVAPSAGNGSAIQDGFSVTIYQPALADVQVYSATGEVAVAYFR